MDATSLFNFSPLLHILLMGLVLASGPLAWIWLRQRGAVASRRLHALTLLTLFLTFDLVIFGAFTRLTDSGLGCPDWPGCYGQASPVGAASQISAAQQALPSGPVTHGKAWIEMIHRYLATGVGVLILTLAVASWRERARILVSPGWAALTLAWVCLQGAFGAFTVTLKLFPAIVTLHLLGGMGLLALLRVQATRYQQAHGGHSQRIAISESLRIGLVLTAILLACQLALGGWVSSNYAVLACNEFPMCQNSWWPLMDFDQAFSLWRPLGLLPDGSHISFQALTAIHYTHRLFSLLVFAAVCALAWQLRRVDGLQHSARWLALLALWQFVSGLSNVVLDWPLAAALAHTGGAAGLVVVLSGLLACSHPSSATVSAARRTTTGLST